MTGRNEDVRRLEFRCASFAGLLKTVGFRSQMLTADKDSYEMLHEHPTAALRCALRSFSALAGLADNPVHPQGNESEQVFIAAMRGLVVAWATAFYATPPIATQRASAQLLEAAAAFDAKLQCS